MLDSLVRVSRRVGWVTDLLAASLRSPAGTSGRFGPARASAHSVVVRRSQRETLAWPSPAPQGWRRGVPEGTRDTTVWRRATDGTANNRRPARCGTTGHLPFPDLQAVALALPDRLQRPRDESQMRLSRLRSTRRTARVRRKPCSVFLRVVRRNRLNPLATGFRGPTRLPLSSFTYS